MEAENRGFIGEVDDIPILRGYPQITQIDPCNLWIDVFTSAEEVVSRNSLSDLQSHSGHR